MDEYDTDDIDDDFSDYDTELLCQRLNDYLEQLKKSCVRVPIQHYDTELLCSSMNNLVQFIENGCKDPAE
uniref:Interleukin-12 subunit alpha n=1 Tax=Schistosoma mansoni TaxID=6183 RepID=A0A5K4FBA8_SCHMA